MQRLVEQPSGEGEVLAGSSVLGRVQYHLSMYQQFSRSNQPVPAGIVVEGRISPVHPVDLAGLHRRGRELTLRLSDGRTLDFSLLDDKGTIRSTGRGLCTA